MKQFKKENNMQFIRILIIICVTYSLCACMGDDNAPKLQAVAQQIEILNRHMQDISHDMTQLYQLNVEIAQLIELLKKLSKTQQQMALENLDNNIKPIVAKLLYEDTH